MDKKIVRSQESESENEKNTNIKNNGTIKL